MQTSKPWYCDCVLDPQIVMPQSLSDYRDPPDKIFITGATGFIGCYLLKELLDCTDADIIVLVRAKDEITAWEKVKNQMKKFHLWSDCYCRRIIPLTGDLCRERLGLSEDCWRMLEESVDYIYHFGSYVNLLMSYQVLYPYNVIPVIELLKLASAQKKKRLIYSSVINVFNLSKTDPDLAIPENYLADRIDTVNGYGKTKWVADKLLQAAGDRGFAVELYRLPYVCGSFHTGYLGQKDFFWYILKICLQMGFAPDIDAEFPMIPVDCLTQSIASISLRKKNDGCHYYTATGLQKITWRDIFEAFRKEGYQLSYLELSQWQKHAADYLSYQQDRSMIPLKMMLLHPMPFKSSSFDNKNFSLALGSSQQLNFSLQMLVHAFKQYIDRYHLI
ncbi:MAG: thioester reductase domain-containing protein [Hungatella sp.]|jgi:thioester reductase-like protein|nr:thioester reductase domain-containing protein [Hungatella sp.]